MYGIMIALGLCLAIGVSMYRAKKENLSTDVISDLVYCAVIGGLLGTRILYYITVFPQILENPSILWNFREGYAVYGGVIGGVLAGYVYCRWKKVSFLKYFDLVMPQVAMAQAIGRIGCFFAGCCYGKETDLPIGITYTISNFAPKPCIPDTNPVDFLCGRSLYFWITPALQQKMQKSRWHSGSHVSFVVQCRKILY